MSILGKYRAEENKEENSYIAPAVTRRNDESISLKKSVIISTVLHPTVVGLIWLFSFILLLFGIKLSIFDRPTPKTQDIELVLVDIEDTPINKKTPYRSDMNSRAGGHHDPTRKVSMPSPPSGTPQKASQPAAPKKSAQKTPAPQKQNPIQKIVKQATQPTPQPTPKAAQQSAPKAAQQAKPAPPTARPSIKPPMTPRVATKPTSPFKVPVPTGGTQAGHYATGPISGSGTSSSGGGSSNGTKGGTAGGGFAPAPKLAPTGGGTSGGSKLAKGGGGGGSGGGNPGPGNPNGRPGIDAIREPDFGPYMRELQRRIKMNWDPPKGDESKRVVLLFKIAKDGRLLSCSVYKSSGLPSADKAALNAVQVSAPFRPLPPEYKNQSIDIQFTFDYNVFGASSYR